MGVGTARISKARWIWPLSCKCDVCGIVALLFFPCQVAPSLTLLLHTLVMNEGSSGLVKKGAAQSIAVVVAAFFAT